MIEEFKCIFFFFAPKQQKVRSLLRESQKGQIPDEE